MTGPQQNAYLKRRGKQVLCTVCVLLFLAVLNACTCRDTEKPEEPAPIQEPAPPAPAKPSEAGFVTAPMRVVTLAGTALPAMTPIATLQPNAFDKPIATGPPTDANGESRIRFSTEEKVCLRAWDPDLQYFPNNFYEVLPGAGVVKETLIVSMVESASLEAMLFLPDGLPARNENVGVMLFHPVHGPWWPAEADTNDRGELVFAHVPPGNFVLRLKVASGAMVEVPETYIAPGESTHLGMLYLR